MDIQKNLLIDPETEQALSPVQVFTAIKVAKFKLQNLSREIWGCW